MKHLKVCISAMTDVLIIKSFNNSQARDALSAENAQLHARLSEANSRIQQLSAHVAMMRQHTIGFILEQMNTLSPDMGTEV